MNAYVDTVDSPAGPLTFAVNDQGALVRLRFVEGEYAGTMARELEHKGWQVSTNHEQTSAARLQLLEYAHGERHEFDLPIVLSGSAWQVTVWQALTRIPYGETRSYGQLAAAIGRPGAARAVGRANATNHLPLVVPCHRVVGRDGSLVGFAGGVGLKERLLAHEIQELAKAS